MTRVLTESEKGQLVKSLRYEHCRMGRMKKADLQGDRLLAGLVAEDRAEVEGRFLRVHNELVRLGSGYLG